MKTEKEILETLKEVKEVTMLSLPKLKEAIEADDFQKSKEILESLLQVVVVCGTLKEVLNN